MNQNDNSIESRIEKEINHLLDFMEAENTYTDEYKSMVGQFTKIMELRQQKEISESNQDLKTMELNNQSAHNDRAHDLKLMEIRKDTISKETWLTVGTHLAGLVVLMNHERAHVIASKAFGLVKKLF